jgi:hypothetical protein
MFIPYTAIPGNDYSRKLTRKMRAKLAAFVGLFLLPRVPVLAHRLDEYLQATMISVEKERIEGFLRLIPGVAVSSTVLVSIDTNADGIISKAEQQAYAAHVLRRLSLSLDGDRLEPDSNARKKRFQLARPTGTASRLTDFVKGIMLLA